MIELYEKMRADIERTGRSCLHVFGDDEHGSHPFTYTIGNSFAGLPEVLVVGLRGEDGMWVCNAISAKMIEDGRAPEDGVMLDLGGKHKVMAVRCRPEVRDDFTIQAGQYLGREDYDVVQVVVPDAEGRFPGDPACAKPYRDVPVLRLQRQHH